MIERQNVLDLIGKDKRKYSSCIITTYTFDFTFFEERIMSILRTSNIKNVNVFLDGKYLEHYLENTNGIEFRNHKTYSLNSIYETGVFHPKIMLLTGPIHGLLIIGSGNLTSSGLGTNDEIWGTFHLNSKDSQNAPLFATVWNYLKQYLIQAKGFNEEKLSWIIQRSPWLNDINGQITKDFIQLNDEKELKFIGNTGQSQYYQSLLNSLPKIGIKKLTVISPYFDQEGKILEQLNNDLKINEIICISDSEYGLLPIKLNDDLKRQIKFYEWKDCLESFDKRYNRLHAKIFHFEFEDGWEYILLGSANASINALGSITVKPKNAEAGILVRRKIKEGYINDLGINLENAKPIGLKEIDQKNNNHREEIVYKKFENRIVYAEINGNRLSVYLKSELFKESELIILNADNKLIENIKVKSLNEIILEQGDEAHKIYISVNGKRVSNFSLIHNLAYQLKCNPDPNLVALDQIIESLSIDPENGQIIKLLSFAEYNWVDEELENNKIRNDTTQITTLQKENHKVYDKITEEEFNSLDSIQSTKSDLLNERTVLIADVLNSLSKGLIQTRIHESIEEALSKQKVEEQTGAEDIIKQSVSFKIKGEQEAKAIHKHFDRVCGFYLSQLKCLFKNRLFSAVPKRPLTINDLSNVSIAIDLMVIYYGKKYPLNRTEFIVKFTKGYIEQIGVIEKKYKLNKTEKINPGHKDWVYYDVSGYAV